MISLSTYEWIIFWGAVKYCLAFNLAQDRSKYSSVFGSLNDFYKPHLMDLVAKESLFSRNVTFLEGQEDKALLSKLAKEESIHLDFEFFGYGSGVAGNIYGFLKLAKDLGIKAAAIFDGDKPEDFNKCKTDFPGFKVIQLSTDDIRDKHNRGTGQLEKEGLFNKNGNIKVEKKEEVSLLLNELNTFFNQEHNF